MKFKKKRKTSDDHESNSHTNNGSNKPSKPESSKESKESKESKSNDKHVEKEHKKAHKKEPAVAAEPKGIVTVAPSSSKNGLENQDVWICPTCKCPDDGSPMIGNLNFFTFFILIYSNLFLF